MGRRRMPRRTAGGAPEASRASLQSQLSQRSRGSKAEPICEERDPLNTFEENPVTMYQWMRWKNCKVNRMHMGEAYPIIQPPISKCGAHETLNHIDEALEDNKCGRLFNFGKDDVLAVWNESPRKETLACYGIGSEHDLPEAMIFNKALSKSLRAASMVKKPPKPNVKADRMKAPPPSGPSVLDRMCLKMKLDRMPNVTRQLRSSNAFTWLHCPPPLDPDNPFEDNAGVSEINLKRALGMEKPPKPPKHGLRRKHWYCPSKCDEPENRCTQLEWAKYNQDPRTFDKAFAKEMAAQEAIANDPEPRNYDELYKALVPCFVQNQDGNDLCQMYEKCCKDPKDPPSQGCGEFAPDGSGGNGKSGGDQNKDDDEDGDKDKKKRGDGDDKGGGDGGDGGEGGDGGDGDGKDEGRKKKDMEKDGNTGKGDGDKGKGEDVPQPDTYKDKNKGKDKGKGKGKKEPKKPEEIVPTPRPSDAQVPVPEAPPAFIPEAPIEEPDMEETVEKKKKKKKRRKKGDKDKSKKDGAGGDGNKDCPCEICCQVGKEEDTPLIKEMRRRDLERQVRNYLLQMRHRQYIECKDPEYRAPTDKCGPIVEDNCFCLDPRMQSHFDRLQAVQQLQKYLLKRNQKGDNMLHHTLDKLMQRLCNRLTRGGYCCG